jgi:predicted CXXCH cytochrome family protein
VLFVVATVAWALALAPQDFPHQRHAGLFPLCELCHAGIVTGNDVELYPDPASCGSCHDGEHEDRVSWTGPEPIASNLKFSHLAHAAAVGRSADSAACQTCHAEAGAESRMAVGPARAETCLGCHAHEAPEHLAVGRECRTCHLTLAQAEALTPERVRALPLPPSHTEVDFLLDHAPGSTTEGEACATCHAVESCTRCHLNAAAVPAIARLPADARIAIIVRDKPPAYTAPRDHADPAWKSQHGSAATYGIATCANCHEQTGCRTCHRESPPAVVAALPVAATDDPRGVRVPRGEGVHIRGFATAHAVEAAAGTCESCHRESFCESCHNAPTRPDFHLPNFLERHGPEVYTNDLECTSCHNTEVFCRGCHAAAGLGSRERLGTAFHTSNPFWIVGHGEAARRGLEGCASCHAQTTCTRCHSAVSGWRINPHPPGFDASKLSRANPVACRLCHGSKVPR